MTKSIFVCRSVGHTFTFSMQTAFTAPALLITAPSQLITAPAQHISAPAKPPATGAAVYTALFLSFSAQFTSHRRGKVASAQNGLLLPSLSLNWTRRNLVRFLGSGPEGGDVL